MPDKAGDGPGLSSLWPWVVFPLLPLLAAFGLLHLFYDPIHDLSGFTATFADPAIRAWLMLEGLLVYGAVGLFHLGLCLFAILFFAGQIRELPPETAARCWRLAGLLLLLLIVIGVIGRLEGAALQLSYRNVCALLVQSGSAPQMVPESCSGGAPSPLFLLAGAPTVAGLLAALMATAFIASVAAPLPEGDQAWKEAFAARVASLQRAFTLTSALLVTSTICIMLFLELPLRVAEGEASEAALGAYAQGMTVFWGTIFTLTLVAVFAPSAARLLQAARRHDADPAASDATRSWLREEVGGSIPRRLANLATLVAPLLVGPVGSLIQKAAEAGAGG